jgi:hypothetical protein
VAYLKNKLDHGIFRDNAEHEDGDDERNAGGQPDLPIVNPQIQPPDLTAEEAFAHLVELSSHSNTKLRDVAASIVSQSETRTSRRRTARRASLDGSDPELTSGDASAAVVDLYAAGVHLDRRRVSDHSL